MLDYALISITQCRIFQIQTFLSCIRLEVKIFVFVFVDQDKDYDNDHETLSLILKFPKPVGAGLKTSL